MRPVASPSLFPAIGVPSSRNHIWNSDRGLQAFQLHAIDAKRHPPSLCCLLKTSFTMVFCCSGVNKPENFVEAQSRKTRLSVDCDALSRFRYSRSNLRLSCIDGNDEYFPGAVPTAIAARQAP